MSEAEDAVQEAWLRLNRIDAATIDNLGGWLTTVVSRLCQEPRDLVPCPAANPSGRMESTGRRVTDLPAQIDALKHPFPNRACRLRQTILPRRTRIGSFKYHESYARHTAWAL